MSRDPLAWLDDELKRLEGADLRRVLAVRHGAQRPGRLNLEGRQVVSFASNDYLGLAAESLLDSVVAGLPDHGWGSGASPLVTGHSLDHHRLQVELARLKSTEASLLFSSGYAANVGTIAALVGKPDAVFSDSLNHASIIDGCRLSGATKYVYPHADADALREQLRSARGFRRRLIVTDAIFSMGGDLAPLGELVELASTYDCMLMVDEAHATGVFGKRGSGLCEHLGVEGAVHVRLGTLSKAFGSSGAYVAGSESLIQWLANNARTYMFSTAPSAAVATAGLAAIEIVRGQPERRAVLLRNAEFLRERLRVMGVDIGRSRSQIVPVHVGEPRVAMDAQRRLLDRGVLVPAIRPPTVPPGRSLLRISLSYAHTEADIELLLGAIEACLAKRLEARGSRLEA